MGYPGKAKKIYNTPHHPWQKARIEEETALVKKYRPEKQEERMEIRIDAP